MGTDLLTQCYNITARACTRIRLAHPHPCPRMGRVGADERAPLPAPPKKKLGLVGWLYIYVVTCVSDEGLVMDTVVMNKVLDLYASGALVRVVCNRCNVSISSVMRVLRRARAEGDVRVLRRRRLLGGERGRMIEGMLGVEGGVSAAEIAELLWGDELPSTWRSVVGIEISKLRKAGVVVKNLKGRYVLA